MWFHTILAAGMNWLAQESGSAGALTRDQARRLGTMWIIGIVALALVTVFVVLFMLTAWRRYLARHRAAAEKAKNRRGLDVDIWQSAARRLVLPLPRAQQNSPEPEDDLDQEPDDDQK